MDICGLIRRLPELVAYDKFDDDFFDRLNYSHTVVILTIFAIIVTNRQFSENQIKCWVPAQFTGSYEQYVNQICFIKNTYSHDMNEPLPNSSIVRHEHELKYYQWTPFILLLMAVLFYIPRQFWRGLSLRSGVDIKDLIEAAQTYRSANVRHEDKLKLLEYLTNWLNGYCSNSYRLLALEKRKQAKIQHFCRHLCFPMGIYTGNYLMICYLFIKFLYLLNSIGQILLLNTLLGRKYWSYGIEVIYQYWTKQIGILYTGNEYFPKVVLCDFTVREPNHPKESHIYTVQCVLPFNLFNQQIFTYLYFWLIILSVFNASSILVWLYRMSPYTNFRYLERRLLLHFLSDADEIRSRFVYRYLQGDGTFLLRLLTSNVSDYVCQKIIYELYRKYRSSLMNETIGREPLFQSISKDRFEDDGDDEEEETTDQTNTDFPPIPNPRQGKFYIENDTLSSQSQTSSDMSIKEIPEQRRAVSFSLPTANIHENIKIDLSHPEFDRQTPTHEVKTPSPYATTYLPSPKKRNEQELPYIDDSVTSSSNSARSNNAVQTQQKSPQVTCQRSHDV